MKLLYFSLDFETDLTKGIVKKVLGQLDGFISNDVSADLVWAENKKINYRNTEVQLFNSKLTSRFDFYLTIFKLRKEIFKRNYNAYYFRYSIGNVYLFLILKYIKRRSPNSIIIVEIPTYPYKQEIRKSFKNQVILKIDSIFQKVFAKKLLNYIVTFSNDNKISQVSCINIKNGISPLEIPLTENIITDKLTLIGVAGLEDHTGYDRIIDGLRTYYLDNPNFTVEFIIVGEGSLKGIWENKILEYKLEKYVIFKGIKTGMALNELYNNAHIGISNIALFRKGNAGDSLKAKEYLKFGLPIIVDKADNYFNSNFVFEVSSTDEAINIKDIISFANKVYDYKREDISDYAIEEFSWKKQTKKIINVINNYD